MRNDAGGDEATLASASAPAVVAPRRVLPVIVLAQLGGTSTWSSSTR